MVCIPWHRFPLVSHHPHVTAWLVMQANLGLAKNTLEAYARALEEYLQFSLHYTLSPSMRLLVHTSPCMCTTWRTVAASAVRTVGPWIVVLVWRMRPYSKN
jgi:hypothetical protein